MINALYIDDELERANRDAQKIKELLELTDQIKVKLSAPPKDFSDILDEQPDLFLIDLDLSTAQVEGENISYFGSTLAAEMRMRSEECPIILITRPEMLEGDGNWKSSILESKADIDLLLYKNQINEQWERETQKIVALVEAFRKLNKSGERNWQSLVSLIGAQGDEEGDLREAAPPIERNAWNIPQAVRWIRKVLIAYPGILYDDLTAATRLGISIESFWDVHEDVFSDALYEGVMSTYDRRWWRSRLFKMAYQLMSEAKIDGPLFLKFREAYLKVHEVELEPSICVYDGTPTADWVCYILKEPVKQQNSVPYYPDNRPPIMDQARVSFKAISERNIFDEDLIDADSMDLVHQIWDSYQ